MREAFVYMFKDNCFGKKAILYFTLSFIASVCSAYALMHSCTGACPITTGNGIFIPNKYLNNRITILYILFFLDTVTGIIKNIPTVKIINANVLVESNENNVRNKNNIGKPIYKSFISIYFPKDFFILLIVIYIFTHLYP